jgi:hypothetical protein
MSKIFGILAPLSNFPEPNIPDIEYCPFHRQNRYHEKGRRSNQLLGKYIPISVMQNPCYFSPLSESVSKNIANIDIDHF